MKQLTDTLRRANSAPPLAVGQLWRFGNWYTEITLLEVLPDGSTRIGGRGGGSDVMPEMPPGDDGWEYVGLATKHEDVGHTVRIMRPASAVQLAPTGGSD